MDSDYHIQHRFNNGFLTDNVEKHRLPTTGIPTVYESQKFIGFPCKLWDPMTLL
jgi:hypothetical protein